MFWSRMLKVWSCQSEDIFALLFMFVIVSAIACCFKYFSALYFHWNLSLHIIGISLCTSGCKLMGLLDSCSTSPVTMRGIVMMDMNMAEDGGAICHLLRDEATLRCTKSIDHFFTLDIPDLHSRVYVRNNTASGGGGVAFARCLQHHLSAPGEYNFFA